MLPFLLGPLGALRALPSPHRGNPPEATATRIGAVHRSLSGRPTIDRLATRRTWTLVWPFLDPDTYAYLDALHQGMVTGPLWLIEPSRPNRFAPAIASTGSTDRSPAGFTAVSGAVTWSTQPVTTDIPLAGGITWQATAAASRMDATPIVPVLPGETLTFSAHVVAARPVRLTLQTLYPNGAIASEHQTDEITPGLFNGARIELTVVPPASAASCRVGVSTGVMPSESWVATWAWQLEAAPFATRWRPGGGAAQVLVESLPVTYPVPGSYGTTLTLLEV